MAAPTSERPAVDGGIEPAPPARRSPRPARAVVLVLLAVAAGAWVVLLWGVANHVWPGNSDGANALLAGRSMVHGNVLLHGWRLPSDPMVVVDVPLYGVFAVILGVNQTVLHAVPVALAVVAVAVACWVASVRVTNRLLAAGVAFVLVGLPVRGYATWLLQTPMHVSTTILCLLAFVLLASEHRSRWWAATAVLTIALFADPFAYVIGVGPVLAAGAAGALAQRRWSRLVSAGAASVLAVVAALAVRAAVSAVGFNLSKSVALGKPGTLVARYRSGAHEFFQLLGATRGTPRVSQNPVLHWVHLVGAAAIVAAFVVVVVLFVRAVRRGAAEDAPAMWIDHTLLFGVLASIGGFALLYNGDPSSRYLMAGVIFAGALVGRVAGRWTPGDRAVRRAVAGAVLVVGVLYALTPISITRHKTFESDAERVVAFLHARNLHDGLGPYWFASYITVLSRDRAHIRPVVGHDGRLAPYTYFATTDWFKAHPSAGRFVLLPQGEPDGVTLATATATFGPPSSVEAVGDYRIAIWPDGGHGQLGKAVDESATGGAP